MTTITKGTRNINGIEFTGIWEDEKENVIYLEQDEFDNLNRRLGGRESGIRAIKYPKIGNGRYLKLTLE